MLLNSVSADRALSRPRARNPILIFCTVLVPLTPALLSAKPVGQQSAKVSPWKIELRERQQKLDAAKQSGDPVVIGDASREVIASALHQIGRLKLIEGARPEATEIYRRSLDFEDSPDIRIELSAAYRAPDSTPGQRQSAKAQEKELSKILASALNDLGATEARQQKFDLALAHFHEAERWRADTPGLMRNIGMAAVRIADYPEAVRALRLVLVAEPHDQVVRSLLGTSLFSTQNFAEAVQVFAPLGDSALREPELAYAWVVSLVRTAQFPQATALLDKVEKQPLPAETLVLVAQAWSQMGNYPRAVESCHKALQLDPKLAQAHFTAGMAQILAGRPAEAVSEFSSELELDPDNNDAQYHLAFALLQLSRSDEAIPLLRGVLTRDPNHAQANYELGRELLNEGRKEESIRYLETAARLSPQLDAVHYQLQSAYRALGRRDDADRELKLYREMKAKNRNLNRAPM
ncbi:MAG TPA: tetratricopeptide repeat protein [Candidatus Binatia bacterium]|nr:tetratricopeptide repeat protein [Candidatus Binatia bacterium]